MVKSRDVKANRGPLEGHGQGDRDCGCKSG